MPGKGQFLAEPFGAINSGAGIGEKINYVFFLFLVKKLSLLAPIQTDGANRLELVGNRESGGGFDSG